MTEQYINTRLALTTYDEVEFTVEVLINKLSAENISIIRNMPENCDIEIVDQNGNIIDESGDNLYFAIELDVDRFSINSLTQNMNEIVDVVGNLISGAYTIKVIRSY